MLDTNAAVDAFAGKRILVIGDIMLDQYVYCEATRLSPEAPIPILHIHHERAALGGAANVAMNLAAMGARTILLGVVGRDKGGETIMQLLSERSDVEANLISDRSHITPVKTRYIADDQQIMRADREHIEDIQKPLADRLIQDAIEIIDIGLDALVLSDYAKGVLSQRVLRSIIGHANLCKVPVIVDPKLESFEYYAGAWLLTPNLAELKRTQDIAMPLITHQQIGDLALENMREFGISNMLVTLGKDGMLLLNGEHARHFKAHAQEVFDVAGAGDTVAAAMALGIASKLPLDEAGQVASYAAAVAVSRAGVAVVSAADIKRAAYEDLVLSNQSDYTSKIIDLHTAAIEAAQWGLAKKAVGFTNGCFDLLHVGHVELLRASKEQCDRLIVAINSDASVRRNKGQRRPINPQDERARVLAGLSFVDRVIIFDEDTPLEAIKAIVPNVITKGYDYAQETIVGADFVKEHGGRVMVFPRWTQKHTGNIIDAITRYEFPELPKPQQSVVA